MKYEEILEKLAPCGLNCQKCIWYHKNEIKFHSQKLQELLGNFGRYAERFSTLIDPVFKNYPAFKKLLAYIASRDCQGCRQGTCPYPHCGVIRCFKTKGVEFCFQCDEFPCEKTNFDLDLKSRWLQMNKRMKEIGVEAYYEETENIPRYK